MTDGSIFLTYQCPACQQWHGQYLAPIDPAGDVAQAAHIVGEALVGRGYAVAYGALVVWGALGDGHLASIFGDGPLLRATVTRTQVPAEYAAILEDLERYDLALEELAHGGVQTLYADSSWARVLSSILAGDTGREATSAPAGNTMSTSELRRLMGG